MTDLNDLREHPIAPIFAVVLPLITVLGFLIYEITAVATGAPVALKVQGYDPTDFLRGHYIRYDILTEGVEIADPHNKPDTSNEGYLTLIDSDHDGILDAFGDFYWKKPQQTYIHAYSYYDISLDSYQSRYYLNEDLAPIVEKEIQEAGSFEIIGTVKDGHFRADHILVAGNRY